MATTIKYALYDTPIDFAQYFIGTFSESNLNKSKEIADKVGLVANILKFSSKVMGYSHAGFDSIANQCESYQIIHGAFTSLPDLVTAPSFQSVKTICKYVKTIFSGFSTWAGFLEKFALPIKNTTVKTVGALGKLAGGLVSMIDLSKNFNDINACLQSPASHERNLQITALIWDTAAKVASIALASLTIATVLVAPYIAVAAVPYYVAPAISLCSSLFSVFKDYVQSHAPVKKNEAPKVEKAAIVESPVNNEILAQED
jgi:hypothetical protein